MGDGSRTLRWQATGKASGVGIGYRNGRREGSESENNEGAEELHVEVSMIIGVENMGVPSGRMTKGKERKEGTGGDRRGSS